MQLLNNLDDATKKRYLEWVWNNTHKDYRSTTGGNRKVLWLMPAGTSLVPLEYKANELLKQHGLPKGI